MFYDIRTATGVVSCRKLSGFGGGRSAPQIPGEIRARKMSEFHSQNASGRHDHDHPSHDHLSGDHSSTLVKVLRRVSSFAHHHHDRDDHDGYEGESRQGDSATRQAIRATQIGFAGLAGTALLQTLFVAFTGSVALLADTIHNFGDALIVIPLWVAFWLGGRPANSRYTYGLGRLEDLAGVVIVVAMLASAGLVVWESVQRLLNPREIDHLPLLAAASIIGFLGNEVVAVYKMRVGRRTGSAALVASARHARADGLTSLAVGGGAIGIALGFPVADPVVGLVIAVPILFMTWNSGVGVWRRLLDGVEPGLPERLTAVAAAVPGAQAIQDMRVRWVGHTLYLETCVVVDEDLATRESHQVAEEVRHALFHAHSALGKVTVHVDPCGHGGKEPHIGTLHHEPVVQAESPQPHSAAAG